MLTPELLADINKLAAKLPEAGREQFIREAKLITTRALDAKPTPQPDQTMAQAAIVTLAEVKGDATLLRQWNVYQELLTTVVVPPKGRFKTLEEARAGQRLANTYQRARARQEKLGIELVPENDKYIGKVSSASALFYQQVRPKTSLGLPVRAENNNP